LERNLRDRSFSQFHHHVLDSRYLWHGPHMLGLWLGQVVRKALDTSRADSLIDYCLDLVMQCFADRSSGTISEVIDPDDYTLDSHLARIVNPGHALESCWFCMEEGMRRNDSRLIERATNLCAGSLEVGLDKLHGGVLAFVNRDGTPPIVGKNQWGENWDDKIWWVQAEALYATALGAVLTKNDQLLTTFCELHEYVFRNFWDSLYGEWYPYLSRSNHVRESNKGNWIKSCFHLPRSLMKLTLLFRRLAGEP
jgi:N-acylglucosamine 2-epimerase